MLRPALSSKIENLDEYDVIFLGYPNWNSDLPMPLYSFLEEYDFSGKTHYPLYHAWRRPGFSGSNPARLRKCSRARRSLRMVCPYPETAFPMHSGM